MPSRSTSEKRRNKNQVWIIPAQDITSPSSPCPTVSLDHCSSSNTTTGAVWGTRLSCLCLQWAKTKPADNQRELPAQKTLCKYPGCIFNGFFFFWMPWKEDEAFKTTMKRSLFNLGQCSNAWDAEAAGGQAETAPFLWVQNYFLTPFDHQSNCSSSPAVAVWEFAVHPLQEPSGSNIKGDLLWEEDATCNKGLVNLQWGNRLMSLCGTLEMSPLKINKEPRDVVEWITLPGLLGPQFWASHKGKLSWE